MALENHAQAENEAAKLMIRLTGAGLVIMGSGLIIECAGFVIAATGSEHQGAGSFITGWPVEPDAACPDGDRPKRFGQARRSPPIEQAHLPAVK